MWPCRSTFAGITVLPVRLTRCAPAGMGISPRRPTRVNRLPSATNAEFSIGARPSPVMRRAPSKTVTSDVPACPFVWKEHGGQEKACGEYQYVFHRCAGIIHQGIGVDENRCYTRATLRF